MTTEQLHSDAARHIGGESGHRSFFGGTVSKTRVVGLLGAFLAMLVLTPILGIWGLALGLGVGLVVFFLTQRTHRGSILDRRTRRARWRARVKAGTDAFEPFDVAVWDQREQAAAQARGRTEKWEAARQLAVMRTTRTAPTAWAGCSAATTNPESPGTPRLANSRTCRSRSLRPGRYPGRSPRRSSAARLRRLVCSWRRGQRR